MKFVVGDINGQIKEVDVVKKAIPHKFGIQEKDADVHGLAYAEDESSLTVLRKSGVVELYETTKYEKIKSAQVEEEALSMSLQGDKLWTLNEEGKVQYVAQWQDKDSKSEAHDAFEVAGPLRGAGWQSTRVAIGGKDNPLKVYDLERGVISWKAKNSPDSTLDLKWPVKISTVDWAFENIIVTGTLDCRLKMYDVRTQRRACVDLPLTSAFEFACPYTASGTDEGRPIISTAIHHGKQQMLVGDSVGTILNFDLSKLPTVKEAPAPPGRKAHNKWAAKQFPLIGGCKGMMGSVRSISYHPSGEYFAAVGLGRFAQVFKTSNRKQICKVYLKQKLNRVVFSKDEMPKEESENEEEEEEEEGDGEEESEEAIMARIAAAQDDDEGDDDGEDDEIDSAEGSDLDLEDAASGEEDDEEEDEEDEDADGTIGADDDEDEDEDDEDLDEDDEDLSDADEDESEESETEAHIVGKKRPAAGAPKGRAPQKARK